jgi:hypothetical protein
VAKRKSHPDIADGTSPREIAVCLMISQGANPDVHAALNSLNGHDLTRRVQHLLVLGLAHERQTALIEAVTEQATLASELMRSLFASGGELRLRHTHPNANVSKQPDNFGGDTGQSETKKMTMQMLMR